MAEIFSSLRLPKHFTPTHQTDGLAGFPAIDIFCKGGTYVCAEFAAKVIKLSGHAPTPSTQPGGPYGWSIYLQTAEGVYFATHFGSRSKFNVKLGQVVPKGHLLGRIADYSKATNGVTPSHIHWGFHKGVWTP